jgi:hypothetical protein
MRVSPCVPTDIANVEKIGAKMLQQPLPVAGVVLWLLGAFLELFIKSRVSLGG